MALTLMEGNEAIGWGAISAGSKDRQIFVSGSLHRTSWGIAEPTGNLIIF